jgi:hypothetical protein
MKRRIGSLALSVLPATAPAVVFLIVAACLSCSPKLQDRVKAFEETYNRHDVEGVLAMFAENGVFEVPGSFTLRGRDDIRQIVEYDAAMNTQVSFGEYLVKDNVILCDMAETNDWLTAAGIKETQYSVQLVFEKGLIQLFRAQAGAETKQAISEVVGPMTEWASKERPAELEQIMPAGNFVYNAQNGRLFLTMLKDWMAATRAEAE